MVILIGGTSHTGKTLLAQKLLETHHWPYLSLDHLKMGLIRSGQTRLTPMDDDQLTGYLWPIAREIVKTAIENNQNLILEGCYIPASWQQDFPDAYRENIRGIFLVMTESYIRNHFNQILSHACAIESRLDDGGPDPEMLIRDNCRMHRQCLEQGCEILLIEEDYTVGPEQLRF